jgi:hypothetical protein
LVCLCALWRFSEFRAVVPLRRRDTCAAEGGYHSAPTLAARHKLHHRSTTTRRSAHKSVLSQSIISHIRLRLTSPAQMARSMGSGARWGADSDYATETHKCRHQDMIFNTSKRHRRASLPIKNIAPYNASR